jgi:NAD-dependent dihydropyrimidine dehydrogenase PreA subunit
VGQDADTSFLREVPGVEFTRDGTVVVSASMMTGCPGVFAGGDMVPAERTVTVGTGHGKKAARFIDAYLRRQPAGTPPKHPVASFDLLHPWYFTDAGPRHQPERDPAGWRTSLRWSAASPASRPGTRRPAACPAATASSATGAWVPAPRTHRYRFDYDRCTGCGTCYDQRPVHAIEMIGENR